MFQYKELSDIKAGDVLISTSGANAFRNVITQVRHTVGSSRYVFHYLGMNGADYVALDAPDALIIDSRAYDVMTPDNYSATLYEGQLALYRPLYGGYVKVRILAINLEAKTANLEVTATRDALYKRGYVLHDVSFNRIAHRGALRTSRQRPGTQYELFRPRFSKRWIDYPTAREITRALESK